MVSAFDFGPSARRSSEISAVASAAVAASASPEDDFAWVGSGIGKSTGDQEHLRSKLLGLGSTFQDFDRRVEDDTRRRRELEEQHMQEIVEALSRLEERIGDEANAREEAALMVSDSVGRCLDHMVSSMQASIVDRFKGLGRCILTLADRCSNVERGIQQFRGEIPSKLGVETAALRHDLRRLFADFQADRQRRTGEDAQLLRAVEESERSADARIQQELRQLDRQREALQELIDDLASGEECEAARRQRALAAESVEALEAELAEETGRREFADDQVVQAINEYTSLLHRSLRVATA